MPIRVILTSVPLQKDHSIPADAVFRSTHWSVVLAAGDADSPRAEEALARLCGTYWPPIYSFVRKRGLSPEQAQDLTQGFFAQLLAKNSLARADRERGRFRCFLMTSVENFLNDQLERASAQKRGGGQPLFSLDTGDAEERYLTVVTDESNPATEFEKQWAKALIECVLGRLRTELAAGGRTELFDALQPHLWGDFDAVPYAELAVQCGMSVVAVKVAAHRMRVRCRELLRDEIAQTVTTSAELDDELRYLMKVVSR